MADMDSWSADSNEAVKVSIVQPTKDSIKTISTFHPKFTYPMFENETIFGYKNLNISMSFSAHDLRPNVSIYYDRKFNAVGDTAATNIKESLANFLPKDAFAPLATYQRSLQEAESLRDFKPPGKKIRSYHSKGKEFSVWAGTLADPEVRLLLDRMQIFVSFFIEGGTPIKLDDQEWTLERWTVWFLYETLPKPPTPNSSIYSIAGYATAYRFWNFPYSTEKDCPVITEPYPPSEPIHPSSLKARLRISQFLILPYHRSQGHGMTLYKLIYEQAISDPLVTELTVEDPNEEFDAVRDYADAGTLLESFSHFSFNPTPIPTTARRPKRVPTSQIIDLPALRDFRVKVKIAPRQFWRMFEMSMLSRIPASARNAGLSRLTQKHRASNESDRQLYWWRLLVKQRIYRKQRDLILQLDASERAEALDNACSAQQEEYEERLAGLMRRLDQMPAGELEPINVNGKGIIRNGAGASNSGPGSSSMMSTAAERSEVAAARAKRKLAIDDDDDDDDDDEGEEEDVRSGKRVKFD